MAGKPNDSEVEVPKVKPGQAMAGAASIDADADREVKTWGKYLASCPKRLVRIPEIPDDEKANERGVVVGFNGHNTLIRRGVDVEVPEPIYEILRNARLA